MSLLPPLQLAPPCYKWVFSSPHHLNQKFSIISICLIQGTARSGTGGHVDVNQLLTIIVYHEHAIGAGCLLTKMLQVLVKLGAQVGMAFVWTFSESCEHMIEEQRQECSTKLCETVP